MERRIENEREEEILIAFQEQNKITHLRIDKLLDELQPQDNTMKMTSDISHPPSNVNDDQLSPERKKRSLKDMILQCAQKKFEDEQLKNGIVAPISPSPPSLIQQFLFFFSNSSIQFNFCWFIIYIW